MKNKILYENILTRVSELACEKSPLTQAEISKVEKILEIKFPQDFVELNSICSYEYICFCSSFNFSMIGDYSVIGVTLAWRANVNFPRNCIALAEEGESALIMRINDNQSEVIWCAIEDLYNICEGKQTQYNPTIFSSFADFYSFLLDEEKNIR